MYLIIRHAFLESSACDVTWSGAWRGPAAALPPLRVMMCSTWGCVYACGTWQTKKLLPAASSIMVSAYFSPCVCMLVDLTDQDSCSPPLPCCVSAYVPLFLLLQPLQLMTMFYWKCVDDSVYFWMCVCLWLWHRLCAQPLILQPIGVGVMLTYGKWLG